MLSSKNSPARLGKKEGDLRKIEEFIDVCDGVSNIIKGIVLQHG